MAPRPRSSANLDTRTAILDAAQDLIQTLGVNAMSYQHISDAVQIRKASIHYHFPTKDDLVDALLERYHETFLGLVDEIVDTDEPASDKLRRYVELFESTLRDGRAGKVCLCGVLGAELASLGSPAVEQVKRFYRDNARRLATILAAGRRDGSFRFTGDPKTLALLVFSLLEGAMLVVRADGGVKQFHEIAEQLAALLTS